MLKKMDGFIIKRKYLWIILSSAEGVKYKIFVNFQVFQFFWPQYRNDYCVHLRTVDNVNANKFCYNGSIHKRIINITSLTINFKLKFDLLKMSLVMFYKKTFRSVMGNLLSRKFME